MPIAATERGIDAGRASAPASACLDRRARCPRDRARPSPAADRSGGTRACRARRCAAPRRGPGPWCRWCPGRSRRRASWTRFTMPYVRAYIDSEQADRNTTEIWLVHDMSEWKTRITKVQVLKPKVSDGEGCLVLIYPPGPDMGRRWPLGTDEIVARPRQRLRHPDRSRLGVAPPRARLPGRRPVVRRGPRLDQRHLRQRRADPARAAARRRLREDRLGHLQVPVGRRRSRPPTTRRSTG